MTVLLITGTDTGVGKTLVSASLLLWARSLGLRVGGMKPIESGCTRRADGSLHPGDGALLREAAGAVDPLDVVCPYRLEAPLAPGIAARREGVDFDLSTIEERIRSLAERHGDGLIVEGAGGLLVPLTPDFATLRELAPRLGASALVVARPTLGTINHSALTVEALRAAEIPCKGVVLNRVRPGEEEAARDNAAAIEAHCGVPVLAAFPEVGGGEMERASALAALWSGRKLDLPSLLA